MNVWAVLLLNLATRRAERTDQRQLVGETLVDEIRDRWTTSPRTPSSTTASSTSWIRVHISATCAK